MAETYHIVTSPSSPCAGEFIGEPCLTLKQYAASPSQDSNVTLVIESGTHRLQIEAELATRIDYFTMLAGHGHKDIDATHIVFYDPRSIYYYYSHYTINYALTSHISRIHFSSSAGYTLDIRIENVQQLFIEDCTFQGVQIYLSEVINAVILQTCFYNGSGLTAHSSIVKITRCTFRNNTQAVDFYSYSTSYNISLSISESTFINNMYIYTSAYTGGAAVYIRVPRYSRVLINASIFVNNTAVARGGALYLHFTGNTKLNSAHITGCTFMNNTVITQEGGALYLTGDSNVAPIYITACTFIYNLANSSNCGAISVQDINVTITDSNFYYNRANGDGGVACVRSANINITNSTFVQNIAVGNGGALLLDESNVHVSSNLFKNNRAGQDGGALATYVHPSTYMIIQSTFTDNYAADDGGAVFIGCAESILRVSLTTFSNNQATDRGGAITLYGSRIDMITTNVYDNMAYLGNSMCTCSSEVNTSLSAGQRDTTQPECTNYDTNINYHDLPLVQEQGYPDIIHLSAVITCSHSTAFEVILSTDTSLYNELQRASATAYAAVTISVTVALAVVLYVIITKAFQYRAIRLSRATSDGAPPADDQGDPLYDEARVDYASTETDTKDIEMMPNVVYGKHTCN